MSHLQKINKANKKVSNILNPIKTLIDNPHVFGLLILVSFLTIANQG